jgi:hypothetical protein
VDNGWEDERQCLAATSVSHANHVASGERHGPTYCAMLQLACSWLT